MFASSDVHRCSSFAPQQYQKRLVNLLAYEFRKFELPLALSLIDPDRDLTSMNRTPTPKQIAAALTPQDLNVFLTPHDLNRLELYARNMVDHHMVLDLMPTIARLLFCGRLPTLRFAFLQVVIMLGIGLQHRSVESLSEELQLPANQVLAFFNKVRESKKERADESATAVAQ